MPEVNQQVPLFYPDNDYAEKRVFEGGQTVLQNGHEFTLRGLYIGPDPDWKPPQTSQPMIPPASTSIQASGPVESPPDNGRAGVLARAQEKLSGYSNPVDNSEERQENSRARNAERLAE